MPRNLLRLIACAFTVLTIGLAAPDSHALDRALVDRLASDDMMEKLDAIEKIAVSGETAALALLQAMQNGEIFLAQDGRAVIVSGDAVLDAATMQTLDPAPGLFSPVILNNRIRARLQTAIGALSLLSPERSVRLESATSLQWTEDVSLLPVVSTALESETDATIRGLLVRIEAQLELRSDDPQQRLAAVEVLGNASQARVRAMVARLTELDHTGAFVEPDPQVRAAALDALRSIDRRLLLSDFLGRVFSGLSLGSILLLAALGLAITYGLLGVINLAHGEMLMIGAYATFVTQQMFRAYFPEWIDWYLAAALPVAFVATALVGMALERSVIRWLYGRPLETLLATWGISLFLIQAVRQTFGAQNVEVANPTWMSGGITVMNVAMAYNRIVIIVFAMIVLLLMWLLLARTRLGLFIRSVTQNRTMASCVGVPTARVDLMAFGLGSGIAGLAGVALSQIGNVGPDLGQAYIIDSFMVVVLGGVGQLAGTVYAALGLGVFSKFIEPHIGAVLTKILVLVLIIAVIQKRPQGLFALKGRAVES